MVLNDGPESIFECSRHCGCPIGASQCCFESSIEIEFPHSYSTGWRANLLSRLRGLSGGLLSLKKPESIWVNAHLLFQSIYIYKRWKCGLVMNLIRKNRHFVRENSSPQKVHRRPRGAFGVIEFNYLPMKISQNKNVQAVATSTSNYMSVSSTCSKAVREWSTRESIFFSPFHIHHLTPCLLVFAYQPET